MRFRQPKSPKSRLRIVAWVALVWALAITGKLYYLQVVKHKDLTRDAERQQHRTYEISMLRGAIVDRTGHQLALSIPATSVAINPQKVKDPEFFSTQVAATLGLDAAKLRQRIEELKARTGAGRGNLLLKRNITEREMADLRNLPFGIFEFISDARREYPNGAVGAHVVGSLNAAGEGDSGVEQALNEDLAGRPGKMRVLVDSLQDPYVNYVSDPGEPGENLTLTIHNVIQYTTERALEEGIAESKAERGSVVVMDPSNGEILALANYPSFDPSAPVQNKTDLQNRLNTAVQAPCEPGSVMKMITVTMGLESGRFRPDTPVFCENGSWARPGRSPIHDIHRMGTLDVAGVLVHSSNIGVAKISATVGPRMLYDYLKRFGIGDRTHVELPGETGGLLWPVECGQTYKNGRPMPCWSSSSHEYIAFGHEVGATAVQLARAVSVIANGGMLVSPHLVMKRERPNAMGQMERLPLSIAEPKRVIKPETALTVRRIMQDVVAEGTGRRAKVPGYTVGGKTGSAEIYDQATHRWLKKSHNSSFIGFAPATNPRIVIVVTLNKTPEQGGRASAPVFAKIAETALRILQVPKDDPDSDRKTVEPEPVPEGQPLDEQQPRAIAKKEEPKKEEKKKEEKPETAPVAARTYLTGPRVPDFRGKAMVAVMREAAALGVPVEVVGAGVAREQKPAPGEILPVGGKIHVVFARP